MRRACALVVGLGLLAGCNGPKVENYFVNRTADLVDILRIKGMAGPGVGLKAEITQALQFGILVEFETFAGGLHDREVGGWKENVFSWGFFVGEHLETVDGIPYYSGSYGWDLFGEADAAFYRREGSWALDMLNLRAAGMFVLGLDIELRLGEVADFVAGIFQFDPAGDDRAGDTGPAEAPAPAEPEATEPDVTA